MKKLLTTVLLGLAVLSSTACKHPEKKLKPLPLQLLKIQMTFQKMYMLTVMEKNRSYHQPHQKYGNSTFKR
jgi:outer membrane lipopolysaccharide assembly protein LptE/RlpB